MRASSAPPSSSHRSTAKTAAREAALRHGSPTISHRVAPSRPLSSAASVRAVDPSPAVRRIPRLPPRTKHRRLLHLSVSPRQFWRRLLRPVAQHRARRHNPRRSASRRRQMPARHRAGTPALRHGEAHQRQIAARYIRAAPLSHLTWRGPHSGGSPRRQWACSHGACVASRRLWRHTGGLAQFRPNRTSGLLARHSVHWHPATSPSRCHRASPARPNCAGPPIVRHCPSVSRFRNKNMPLPKPPLLQCSFLRRRVIQIQRTDAFE